MQFEVKENINYSAQIVQIKNIIPLENCDNIVSTTILGNNVIVSKDAKIGDIGIFFPVESKLSPDYLRGNNLYRDKTLNVDQAKAGFFEINARIRCIKLRGNRSEGLFMPTESLYAIPGFILDDDIRDYIGTPFDHINDVKICEKYVTPTRTQGQHNKQGKKAKVSKIVPDQFRFHADTEQLGRNLDKFTLDTPIQISVKVHGTSAIASYILCNKKLNIFQKLLLKSGIQLQTTYYDYIHASRKVIKNDDINKTQHFYSEDIWKKGADTLKEFLEKGMTIYFEIVGYLGDNSMIQKKYDYGCEPGKFDIYIYRITHTNPDGKVYEFSADQLQMWCKQRGLKPIVEIWKGTVRDLVSKHTNLIGPENNNLYDCWGGFLIEELRNNLNGGIEKDCPLNKNKVPYEGIVIRKLDTLDFEAYKLKSFRFLQRETEEFDKGENNIEDNQENQNE